MESFRVFFSSESLCAPTVPSPASSPPSPHSRPLQAGFPRLCQHAEWGGGPLPWWTPCPAAPHSGVGRPVEKCPPAADGERSAARESVGSPACVWSRLSLSDLVPLWIHLVSSQHLLPFPPPLPLSSSLCVDASCPDAGRATTSLDLAVNPGSEGGRRRTRRYLPGGGPGGGRKTSERFRTQPITANEMEESSG